MTQKRYLLIVISAFVLSVSFCNHVTANDLNTLSPGLTYDFSNPMDENSIHISNHPGIFVAQNTPSPETDEGLDDELMDEYADEEEQKDQVADPLYYFNYCMYGLNDFLFTGVIHPVSTGYSAITPVVVRKGVRNFFHNLFFPIRFVNNCLQGKMSNAGHEIGIFLINTTIGIAGFMQPAQNHFDLHTSDEDLGQTFGSWNIGEGFYLVLPIFGPSTLRDTIGLVGDSFLNPLNYVEPWELSLGLKVYERVNHVSFHLGEYQEFKNAAVDPYSAFKNAYIQNRNKKIQE